MRTTLTILAGISIATACYGQSDWIDAGLPNKCVGVIEMYADSANDALYCGGYVLKDGYYDLSKIALARYSTAGWEEVGLFNHAIWTIVNYRDTLVVGGDFTTVDSMPAEHVAAYYGGTWHPMGSFDRRVSQLKIFNGQLYATGSFSTVDGIPANGVAVWDGTAWQPLNPIPPLTFGNLLFYDMEMYQGELYLGGSFSFTNGEQDLIKFNGTTWEAVGGGIQSGADWVNQLEVFQDKLYIGGLFYYGPNNARNAIMTWDGTSYESVGTGLQFYTGTYYPNMSVFALKEHDGKLFVGGGQFFAGNVPSMFISSWDGNQWCNVGDAVFDVNEVRAIEFFRDTLFTSSGHVIDGDSVNFIAKWVGGAFSDTCSSPVGITEIQRATITAAAIPNPFTTQTRLLFSDILSNEHLIELIDINGRILRALQGNGTNEVLLERDGLSEGLYVVRINEGGKHLGAVRVVVE